jgi:hypothetical protein
MCITASIGRKDRSQKSNKVEREYLKKSQHETVKLSGGRTLSTNVNVQRKQVQEKN